MNDLFTEKGAEFNQDRSHRFVLWRIWDESKPKIMFIGLNPSTASENQDDPTIRRVIRFASDWGYGGVYMLNLFSYVTAYPSELVIDGNYSPNNNVYLFHYAKKSKEALCAWGNFNEAQQRTKDIFKILEKSDVRKITALQINKNGSPKHPLYVKSDIQRMSFNL